MNSTSKLTMAALACLTLAGCVSPAEMEAARREQERRDADMCVSYGTVPNTPAFDNCMRDMAMRRDPYTYDRYEPAAYNPDRYPPDNRESRYYDSRETRYYEPYPYPRYYRDPYYRY